LLGRSNWDWALRRSPLTPGYAKLFTELGLGSLAVGIALVVLIPYLRKLITDKAETLPAETLATVVPVA